MTFLGEDVCQGAFTRRQTSREEEDNVPDVPQGERRRGNCPGGCERQVFFVVIGCSSAPKIAVKAHNVCCTGILRGEKVQRPVGGAPQLTERCLATALRRSV